MENKIYQILKKHRLPLKKREEILADLLPLFEETIFKQKCAVEAVATGEHCPEIGIHQIAGTRDYLCDGCHRTWKQIMGG